MIDYVSPHFDHLALLVVDMQRDFVLPGAPAEIAGSAAVIHAIHDVITAFRARNFPIVHVVRLYLPDGSNADLCRRSMIAAGKSVAVPGSDGAEVVDELMPRQMKLDTPNLLLGCLQLLADSEWAMYKPRWGAFYATNLESHLRNLGVDTLAITGCNFPNCPRTTLYEASERDFRTILVTDAVSRLYDQGVKELIDIGVNVMTAERLLSQLSLADA